MGLAVGTVSNSVALGVLGTAGRRGVAVLKWLATAQLCWLAWQMAQTRISPGDASGPVPASAGGIMLNLINPATWLEGLGLITRFVSGGQPALQAAALIAMSFLLCPAARGRATSSFREDRAAAVAAGGRVARLFNVLATILPVTAQLWISEEGRHED